MSGGRLTTTLRVGGEGVGDVAGKKNSPSVWREGEFVGNSGQSGLAGVMEIGARGRRTEFGQAWI